MAAEPAARKRAARPAVGPQEEGAVAQPAIAPAPTPIPDEFRDELTALMQELLLKTHELSFEYSTLDCDKVSECPLACKAKELFKVVKQVNELVRRFAPPPTAKPSYIR